MNIEANVSVLSDTDADTIDLDSIRLAIKQSGIEVGHVMEEKMIEVFLGLGVEKVNDIAFIREEDLTLLPPIKQRKFLTYVRSLHNEDCYPNVTISSTESTTSSDHSMAVNTSFKLPFKNLSASTKNSLLDGKRLSRAERSSFLKAVIDDVLKNATSNPGRGYLKGVAQVIADRYPDSFQDRRPDGAILGTGYGSILLQLENKINNCLRPQEGPRMKRPARGCASPQNDLSYDDVNNIKEEMKTMMDTDFDKKHAEDLIKSIFPFLRGEIQKSSDVSKMKSEWPLIFTNIGFKHMYELTTKNSLESIKINMLASLAKILNFMQSQQIKNKTLKKIIRDINDAKKQMGNNQPEVFGLLALIAERFKEDPTALVRGGADEEDLPPTPVVIGNGESVITSTVFQIAVDKSVVFEEVKAAEDALALFFGCFYVFDIEYPKLAPVTLEFIERSFAEIGQYSTDKIKGKRHANRICGIHSKVLSLTNELNEFELI